MDSFVPGKMTRRTFAGAVIAAAMVGTTPATRIAAQSGETYTFLGLGLDRFTEETGQRSDVMMLSRVDIAAQTVRTLSIPRDLYVEIPGYPSFKINDAYNRGLMETPEPDWRRGAELAAQTIAHNFGVSVDGVVLTDMDVFPQVIDAIDGVTVINPYDLEQPGYFFPAGELTLDGKDATIFTRLRDMDGDGGRVMRQHLVLEAMLAKLQTPAILPHIPELVTTLGGVVKTTIPASIQARLIALIPKLSSQDLTFTNIEHLLWSGYTDGGAWIYEGDWSVLPGYVQGWLAGEFD